MSERHETDDTDGLRQQVAALQQQGLNCAQVVLQLCLHVQGAQGETLQRAMRGFGFGMGCGRVCGCLVGGVAAFGCAVQADGLAAHRQVKAMSKALVEWFEGRFATSSCEALKHPPEGQQPVPCALLIEETARRCGAMLGQMPST